MWAMVQFWVLQGKTIQNINILNATIMHSFHLTYCQNPVFIKAADKNKIAKKGHCEYNWTYNPARHCHQSSQPLNPVMANCTLFSQNKVFLNSRCWLPIGRNYIALLSNEYALTVNILVITTNKNNES